MKEYVIGLFLISFSFFIVPLATRSALRNNVVVHSKGRGEVKSFFERKKDDIALAIVSAILGAVISYALTKYAMIAVHSLFSGSGGSLSAIVSASPYRF